MHAMHLDRRIAFGMTLPQSVLDRIDETRGLTPRVRFIQRLLFIGMGLSESGLFLEQGHEERGTNE